MGPPVKISPGPRKIRMCTGPNRSYAPHAGAAAPRHRPPTACTATNPLETNSTRSRHANTAAIGLGWPITDVEQRSERRVGLAAASPSIRPPRRPCKSDPIAPPTANAEASLPPCRSTEPRRPPRRKRPGQMVAIRLGICPADTHEQAQLSGTAAQLTKEGCASSEG